MKNNNLIELLNSVKELESNSNSKNWTSKITGIRILFTEFIDDIENELKQLEKEFDNRDSDIDSHCQSKRLKLLTKINTLKSILGDE